MVVSRPDNMSDHRFALGAAKRNGPVFLMCKIEFLCRLIAGCQYAASPAQWSVQRHQPSWCLVMCCCCLFSLCCLVASQQGQAGCCHSAPCHELLPLHALPQAAASRRARAVPASLSATAVCLKTPGQ